MLEYREIAPSPRLARAVECFWTIRQSGAGAPHRVLPDGCADILFTTDAGSAALDAVGPMTAWRDHALRAGQSLLGLRFRPGIWPAIMRIPGDRLTDAVLPLDGLWGARARELRDRLAEAPSPDIAVAVFEAFVAPVTEHDLFDKALAWMEKCHGLVCLDDLARQAGLSARQFRRVCLQKTGLTPKLLARVLRFRHSLARLEQPSEPCAQLALDCGYYDQAHFINEFREFSGRTPRHGSA